MKNAIVDSSRISFAIVIVALSLGGCGTAERADSQKAAEATGQASSSPRGSAAAHLDPSSAPDDDDADAKATAAAKDDPPRPSLPQDGGGPESAGPPMKGGMFDFGGGRAKRLSAVGGLADGSIPKDEVTRTLDRIESELGKCVQEDMRVDLELRIAPTGDVIESKALGSDPDHPNDRDCVAALIRSLRFPKPTGGTAVTLKFSLAVRPSANDPFKVGQ